MKAFYTSLFAALTTTFTFFVISCSKNEPTIEYDMDSVEGKWSVVSTTGQIVIWDDTLFAANDTVRFFNRVGWGSIYISRKGQNRHYDEIRDISYYTEIDYVINEDKKSFVIIYDRAYTFEIIEARKDFLILRFLDNGTEISMKKIE